MRKDIHPENYRLCVFKDMSSDFSILTKSCAESNETIKWKDGVAPTLTQTNSATDILSFVNIGGTYYGFVSALNVS